MALGRDKTGDLQGIAHKFIKVHFIWRYMAHIIWAICHDMKMKSEF